MVSVANPYRHALYRKNRALVLAASPVCQWPGCTALATTADHITPLAKGGTNELTNLRSSCVKHNSQGGAAIVNERRTIGRRSRNW